ncbi:MAG TPA: DUF3616 domain-containing protein [Blastocatellia bacterium]|nr:DUF3616 domain-containing protein [Blastocatellia bacterium]
MAKEQERQQQKAKLKIALPSGEIHKHKVKEPESRIGSGSHNDIPITDPEVSTTHATLAFDGDGYVIVDGGGGRATFVNGERVIKQRKLAHGDVIKMGNSEITFRLKHAKTLKTVRAPIPPPGAVFDSAMLSANGRSRENTDKKHKKPKKDKHKAKTIGEFIGVPPVTMPPIVQRPEVEATMNREPAGLPKQAGETKYAQLKGLYAGGRGPIIITVVFVLLSVIIAILLSRQDARQSSVLNEAENRQASKKLANLSQTNQIAGEKYEASGATAVPDSNGILFVDDSTQDSVFFMPVNGNGEQDGEIKPIPLGVSVKNPEGISRFGSRFMVVGSLSTLESDTKGGGAAFDFDPATQAVSNAVELTGLRRFLLDNVPELKPWANKTSAEGGLNVEGIAVDPDPERPRVLLGLRGPVINGKALVVPIRILDRKAPLSVENLAVDPQGATELNLNGQAIRDIQYDSRLRAFLIISGAPEYEKRGDFVLWVWNGGSDQSLDEARPKKQAVLDSKMKPEGITHLKISNHEFVFIVGDASSYAKIDYVSR